MTHRLPIALSSILLTLVFSSCTLALNPEAIENIVRRANVKRAGIALGIFKNGQPLFRKGFGFRDRGLPEFFTGDDLFEVEQTDQLLKLTRGRFEPDEDTVFSLASVSKEFTAGAILLLQQQNKLSVKDKLSKYFPRFPKGDKISLLDLVHHTSGITDYNFFPRFSKPYAAFQASGSYDAITKALAAQPLQFEPGSKYQYSNSNYLLLGMIVHKVSRQSLADFLRDHIFTPLRMTNTRNGYGASDKNVALGYTLDGKKVTRTYAWNLQWLAGPGGLTSTVNDLAKWDHAVSKPGLFTKESLDLMFSPNRVDGSNYAFGWVVDTMNGHKYVWHNGEVGGFHAINATFPDESLAIIILANNDGFVPEDLIRPLFEAVHR